jgi:hypothetical protein
VGETVSACTGVSRCTFCHCGAQEEMEREMVVEKEGRRVTEEQSLGKPSKIL